MHNLAIEALEMANYYQYPGILLENTALNSIHNDVELGLGHDTLLICIVMSRLRFRKISISISDFESKCLLLKLPLELKQKCGHHCLL